MRFQIDNNVPKSVRGAWGNNYSDGELIDLIKKVWAPHLMRGESIAIGRSEGSSGPVRSDMVNGLPKYRVYG